MASSPRAAIPAGFTLIECLIALAVISILVSASYPSWQGWVARQSMEVAIGELHSGLNHARLLSITRGRPVVVCPSQDQQSCSPSPEWHRGWITFEDRNRNRERDPGEALLSVEQPDGHGVRITSSRYRRTVRFLPTGYAPGTNLTIAFCGPGEPRAEATLVVSNNGRPRRGDPAGRQCS